MLVIFTLGLVDTNSAVGMAKFSYPHVSMYLSHLFTSFMSHYVYWIAEE
jgi:hypothetical protein